MTPAPSAPPSAPRPPRDARRKTFFFPFFRELGLPFRVLRRTHFNRQLTLIVTVAILLLALFSALLNSWTASLRTQEYLVRQGLQITDGLARRSLLALLYHAPENAESEVGATLAFPDVRYVEIVDANRRTLIARLKNSTPGYMPPSWRHAVVTASDHATLAWENDDEWGFIAPAYAGREETSPFELQEREPQLLGYVLVVVGKASMHELAASLRQVNMGLTLSFAVLLLGVLGLLVQRLIHPLNSLSVLMRRAEAGESGLRAPLSGPRDITDMATAFNKMMAVLEEREAELQHSRDRALHTAQMKAQFAATVSHEVRTPLNGVVGMLDLLRGMRLEKSSRECVDVAWNSAHALMELINGILDFSKLEAGKLELEEISFDLRDQVEGVLELVARQAQQRGLDLGYVLAPGVPARVRGDSLRVRQVLINLMSNAVKFTERGEVAVHLAFQATAEGQGLLRVEVCDTGIGMDESTARHVFESFAQGDPSTTRKYGGTGLGLTISKHLVDLMNGEIGVDSLPGRGSTFWFTVPVAVVEAPAPAASVPAVGTALVLARGGIVRRFVEQVLSGEGLVCQMAGNSDEFLQRLDAGVQPAGGYALIVLDSDALPGETVLAEYLGAEATPPLLWLESWPYEGAVGLQPGRVVAKPLRLEVLRKAVRDLLAGLAPQYPVDAPPPLLEVPGRGGRAYRVLVAEDNRTNQLVAGAMLAKIGCQCEFADNGVAAVEAVRHATFDLILMDCNMPAMDGYAATRHIRLLEQEQGHAPTPIIAMTANAQSGDEEACRAAGMDDYLAKPVTLLKLRHKVDAWLNAGPAAERSEGR